MSDGRTILQHRLLNCLQTIIDLEEELGSRDVDINLSQELGTLKRVMLHIDQLEISEIDVQRVEQATTRFLEELSGPLQDLLQRRSQVFLH
jgi:hypothetical protein